MLSFFSLRTQSGRDSFDSLVASWSLGLVAPLAAALCVLSSLVSSVSAQGAGTQAATVTGPVIRPVAPPVAPTLGTYPELTQALMQRFTGTVDAATVQVEVSRFDRTWLIVPGAQSFQIDVPLVPNRRNDVFFVAINASGERSPAAIALVTQDQTPPALFIDGPADGAEVTTTEVDVVGRIGDNLSGFTGLSVTVNDVPAEIDIGIGTNGTFLATVPLLVSDPPEATEIRVFAEDTLGNRIGQSIFVTHVPVPAGVPRMEVSAGNRQTGAVSTMLPQPVEIQMLQADGQPFVGKIVNFRVTRSDGELEPVGGGSASRMLQVRTDAAGRAQVQWRLGADAGCGNNRLEVTSRDIAGTTLVCASATAANASQINVGTGNDQVVEAGGLAPEPLVVWVSDGCNGVASVPVTFRVVNGGGSVNGQTMVTVPTGVTGHADVQFVAGPNGGNQVVEATFVGNPGLPVSFVSQVVERDRPSTTLVGQIRDNSLRPIGGVPLSLIVAGRLVAQTVSNDRGAFVFDNLQDFGPSTLDVDGFNAMSRGGEPAMPGTFPHMLYHPLIVEGAENRVGMPILLPELDPRNWVSFDNTQDVELTCAESAAFGSESKPAR